MSDVTESSRPSRRRFFYVLAALIAIGLTAVLYTTVRRGEDQTSLQVDEEAGVFEHAASDGAPAQSEWQESQLRASIVQYHSALANDPYNPLLLNNYGWALHLAGRYDHAETTLRQVIQLDPKRAIAYANLGETLWKQGKNAEAANMYRRFLSLNEIEHREIIARRKIDSIAAGPVSQDR